MKIIIVLAILLLVGFVAVLFVFNPLNVIDGDNNVSVSPLPAADFITYKDRTNGFSFKYPIGYTIGASDVTYAYLELKAGVPGVPYEVIQVYLTESGQGIAFAESITTSLEASTKRSSEGELFFSGEKTDFETKFLMNGLAKECSSYDLVFLTAVPEELSVDVQTMKYVLSTVQCG